MDAGKFSPGETFCRMQPQSIGRVNILPNAVTKYCGKISTDSFFEHTSKFLISFNAQ